MKYISIDDLKKLKVWCNWRWTTNKQGKRTKAPLQKVNFPARWFTFGQAKSYATQVNLNGGIGIMFAKDVMPNCAICGIDIDAHSVTSNPLTTEIIELFEGTYIEMSPSGKGYHILFLVRQDALPDRNNYETRYYYKKSDIDVECYIAGVTNRYFTFTGNQQTDDDVLVDKTEQLKIFLEKYMKKTEHVSDEGQLKLTEGGGNRAPTADAEIDVHQRLQIAMQASNGAKFSALWNGDASGYPSASEAVQALINILVFYFGDGGAELVKEVFISSGLAVGKWAKRSDIIDATINNAFARVHKRYTSLGSSSSNNKNGRNNAVRKNSENSQRGGGEMQQKQMLDYNLFAAYVNEKGYSIRYNVITHAFEFAGFDPAERPEHLPENAPTILRDALKKMYSHVTRLDIMDYITQYATRHAYNPVLDLLAMNPWDGRDYLAELYSLLSLSDSESEEENYSRLYIKKWLMQCICGLFTSIQQPFSLDIVLVLQGSQGIGKTRLIERLALSSQFFGEGICLDPRDKDSVMQATSKWICELGEIGSTMRKDMDSLKAFLTRSTDEYRTPYGKASLRYPRITSFVGTVNDAEFLLDETGSRRFAVVSLPNSCRITYTDINRFNFVQLWAQILAMVKPLDKSACFRLSEAELKHLTEQNQSYTKPLKGELEVKDILEMEQTPQKGYVCEMKDMTIFEFIRLHNLHYDARTIGKVFKKLGYDSKRVQKKGQDTRYFTLPYKRYKG